VIAHDSYLINIASPDRGKRGLSRRALRDEMERAEALGIPFLVMHPGAHLGAGVDAGIRNVAASLDTLHAETPGFRLRILLETTAGQGTALGARLEEIERIFHAVAAPERLGVCIDTCHLFAAGYEIRTAEGMRAVVDEVLERFGPLNLLCVHVNDSKKGRGSRVDRHEQIGEGEIGLEAFRTLLHDPRLAAVPKILETPKGDGDAQDRRNLAVLRRLARSGSS